MGGIGSGSWFRWSSRETTERQHRIDIRYLKKQGYLRPGVIDLLSWSWRGTLTGSIRFRMEEGRMVLIYRHRSRGGELEDVEQVITLDRTPCNYGGHRSWFLCPLCWRRVAVLYGAGKYFLCRHCYGLAYSSQHEGPSDRLLRKARKIRERLGASDNLLEPIMFKPVNMHQKTFDRLRREADQANNLSWVIMDQRYGRFGMG